MSIPKIAGIIALVGFTGFVASSLAHAGPGDLIFNLAAVCLVIAPSSSLAVSSLRLAGKSQVSSNSASVALFNDA
jgi:hypothetical protein